MTPLDLADGKWHHVQVLTGKIFIDGELRAKTVKNANVKDSNTWLRQPSQDEVKKKWERSMTPDLRRNERIEMLMWLLTVLLLGILAVALLSMTAKAAEPCLTKEQARAKWPTKHIYWRTPDRCWTNNPKQHDFHKRESKPDLLPRPAPPARADASGNDVRTIYVKADEFNDIDAQADRSPTVLYPAIMPLAEPPAALMLTPTVMTQWSSMLIDVDAQRIFAPWAYRAAGAWER